MFENRYLIINLISILLIALYFLGVIPTSPYIAAISAMLFIAIIFQIADRQKSH